MESNDALVEIFAAGMLFGVLAAAIAGVLIALSRRP